MNTIRSGFMGSFCCAAVWALLAAFIQRNPWPLVIWLVTWALVIVYGRDANGRNP